MSKRVHITVYSVPPGALVAHVANVRFCHRRVQHLDRGAAEPRFQALACLSAEPAVDIGETATVTAGAKANAVQWRCGDAA